MSRSKRRCGSKAVVQDCSLHSSCSNALFLIGVPRSGTTVFSEAISVHDELGWFSSYLEHIPSFPWIALLDRIAQIPVLDFYLRGKKRQGGGFASFFRWLLPYSDEVYSVWVRCCGEVFLRDYLLGKKASATQKVCMEKLVQTILRCHGKKQLFTKLTGPSRIFFIQSIFPRARFIHVIRDPRAVVSSLLKAAFWRNGGGLEKPWWENGLTTQDLEDWENEDRSAVALAAVQWRRVVETTWEERERIGLKRYVEVRYEDFVESPHKVLRGVFEAVGLDDSRRAHRYLDSVGRLSNMNCKYRKHLSRDDISLIERLTIETAQRAGYAF